MRLRAIVRFIGLLWAFCTQTAVLARAAIGGILLGVLVALLNQLGPEQAKPGQQHQLGRPPEKITNREDGEKVVVAKRCAYLRSGKFTEANYAEFVQKHSFELKLNLAAFIEEQCKFPQEFFARLNGASLDYFTDELEVRGNFRPMVEPAG
jgi:hypothetical protein